MTASGLAEGRAARTHRRGLVMNRRSFMVALAAAAAPVTALAGRVADALAATVWFEAYMSDEDPDLKCTVNWDYDTSTKYWTAYASCKNKGTKTRYATLEGLLHISGSSNKTCTKEMTIAKNKTVTGNCHVIY